MVKSPKPRLALARRQRLRTPAKHLAALDVWAEAFAGRYPERSAQPVVHWHLPVDQRLVDPPWAEPAHQAHALAALMTAAGHLLAARPRERTGETIYIVAHWPAMFMAEVGVFFDADYAATFETRTSLHQTWTPLPAGRSLARELGVEIPAPFRERGYRERAQDAPDAPAVETEVWIWRTPAAPAQD